MDDQEEIYKTTGRIAFSTALPLLIFTIVAVIIIAIIAIQRVRQVGGTAWILDATTDVCYGAPLPEAASYDEEPGIHPIVAFSEENGFLQAASNYIKPEWTPTDISEIELVLCVEQVRPAFRALCSDRNVINQLGGEVLFKLRRAQTAGVIAQGVIVSDDNARVECLEALPDAANEDATVPDDVIHDFLARFVEK